MGTCPCWPKKASNYDPYVDDEEYMEYDSPSTRKSAPHRYRTLVPESEPTQKTSNYSHENRPPDFSTYVPPPLPPQAIYSTTPTQEAQQRLSWNQSTPPSNSTSSTPPSTTTTITSTITTTSPTNQQQQYTQYSESAYLARLPEQPTDSMLLDSMMKSSILNHPQYTTNPSANIHHYQSSSSFSSSSIAPSFSGMESGAFDANSSLVDSGYGENSNFNSTTSPDLDGSIVQSTILQSPTAMAESDVVSTSSSIYYDAAGTASSYMMESSSEGAFENPEQPR